MPKAITLKAVPAPQLGGLVFSITQVMQALTPVMKNGSNDHFKYKYVKMPDLMRQITPLMAKNGLVLFQSETGRTLLEDVLAVEYEFTLKHVSGEEQKLKCTGMCKFNTSGKTNDKAAAAAATHARKYALVALFGCVCDDQPDTDHDTSDAPKGIGSQKQQAAPLFNKLLKDLTDITNLGDLNLYGDDNGLMIATLPNDWQKALRTRYVEKLRSFKGEKPTITERAIKARNSLSMNDEVPY